MRKLLLIALLSVFINCQRDDICAEATPTTPNALIEFYNVSNPESLKTVTGLFIVGEGMPVSNTIEGADGNNTSNASLPLKTDAEQTIFYFYKNGELNNNNTPEDDADDFIEGDNLNTDIVTITYNTEEVYVSRACGFKTIFTNLQVNIDAGADGTLWILGDTFEADNETIENENQVHIHFRH